MKQFLTKLEKKPQLYNDAQRQGMGIVMKKVKQKSLHVSVIKVMYQTQSLKTI